MTLTKLAALTGTSVATVSKAFSGSAEISLATREKIFKAAKDIGCFDKYYKGPRERPIIALVFPESESEYYATEIGLLEKVLTSRGADTVIALTRFDHEREARLFRELVYRMKVDGVILAGSGSLIKNPDEIPLVTIGSCDRYINHADNIKVDLERAISDTVSLIKKYGHREVGFIGEQLTSTKLKLFKSAMRQNGLPLYDKYIVTANSRFTEAGESGMKALIDSGKVPSVIVAAYDQIAYGAMSYASAHGYKIPEDISFVGMDDISVTDYLDTPLTSIHIHLEDICEKVADLIFKRIENRHYREPRELILTTSLKLRKSLVRYEERQKQTDLYENS